MKTYKRDEWCDIAKGFAIIAVVFGHLSFSDSNQLFPVKVLFAYLWHVPVFFVISGFYIKEKNIHSFRNFLKTRFHSLFLPTLLFAVGAVVFHNAFISYGLYPDTYALYSCSDTVKAMAKSLLLFFDEPVIGALWFASLLWYASIALLGIHFTVSKIATEYKRKLLIQTSVLFVGCLFFHMLSAVYNINISIINKMVTAMWLMQCGILVKQYFDVKFNSLGIFLLCIVFCYFSAIYFGGTYLDRNEYFSVFTMTPTVLAALYVLCYIGKQLQETMAGNVVAYVGSKSFCIMALHLASLKATSVLLNHYGYCNDISGMCPKTESFPFLAIYMTTGLLLPIIATCGYNKIKSAIVNIRNHKN